MEDRIGIVRKNFKIPLKKKQVQEENPIEPFNVFYQTAEDGVGDTISNTEKGNAGKEKKPSIHERLEINGGHGDYCDLRLFVNC